MANVLTQICDDKRVEIEELKQSLPLSSFIDELRPSSRSMYDALNKPHAGFILECKKASPSKGLIREKFDLDEIIAAYGPYASAISVLTEKKYFQGDYSYVKYVRERVSQPVLNKDFFVDPYQVYLARYHKADAILLMLSVLDDDQYRELAEIAAQYKLDILTEVSNKEELDRAIGLGAKIIGINNRNLRDLSTDLQTTRDLAPLIPEGRLIVSESGIYTHDQVKELNQYANAYLVGSSLMAKANLTKAVKKLILGEHKVCGLTRPEDAAAAYKAGAIYGGLIFAEKSPRYVNLEQAAKVKSGAPLDYVGVFVNESAEQVIRTARVLNLKVVQLHGDEDQAYISGIKAELGDSVKIWKAHNPSLKPIPALTDIDRWLFDSGNQNQPGGTGTTFNWQLINESDINVPYMIAGGLTSDNARDANQIGAIGLDFNSGLESEPGLKDKDKIDAAFFALRQR
ncbi:bifunctional indole-3-glycerol-phosphate synthase TrpC/phosphoribosylanthranilate isomerase TrpF [Saccharobesus litoralis]|uniref:Multifunctional fusion protein n=1 Tax=Saccharobesus litoralis TaxID=2172099 RepID=A0A2S0VU31_9ALTE|nr:bifunctional indole-3-glycerol-phosphate synthase TrpC/phosphoribosylanthranilate isomerase TrpF [Saccharobesus litoralis]AWB67715.1 bifunctional indole-3-glycerol-phosphate synthase TrpC/phosphoribosylanthranilate isomerase TrpF [Saccharobesus litoralis]